ncbi:MAG: hypothetical protein H6908_03920 [Hyphomicrobiales bacterium]|nr:hypothetical protein [Rickettsiales bacterium]MCP5361771.1 hypothetical protein [Hyphomicrobiales bacterium]
MTSWTTKILKQHDGITYLECHYSDNRIAYFVMRISTDKKEAFHQALQSGKEIHLDNYGKVLDPGWGPLPRNYRA